MTLDLARLEALAAAATPGPWKACECGRCGQVWSIPADCLVAAAMGASNGHYTGGEGFTDDKRQAHAAFIAACDPTTVRALCARIRALEAALRPLAEHDCESWGCDPLVTAHDCAPARARALLDGTA